MFYSGARRAGPRWRDEGGSPLPWRAYVDAVGSGIAATDDSTNGKTILTVSGGGSGGGLPVYNVKTDYGAAGDGSTNDTTAIQNAINAAQSYQGGAIVYFPAGYYKITAALTITKPVILQGAQSGMSWQSNLVAVGSVIVNAGTTTNAITISQPDTRPTNKQATAWMIRDLAIDSTAASSSYQLQGYAYNRGPIVNATAIECGANACGVLIENCFIARHATGINLCSDTVNYTADNEVRGTFVYMCRDYGIRMQQGVGNKIRFCNVRANWSPEWTDHMQDSGSQGTNTNGGGYRGISLEAGDGHIIEGTEVISYLYGVCIAPGVGSVAVVGATNVKMVNVWADSCPNPFYVKSRYALLMGCFATACYDGLYAGLGFPIGNAGYYLNGDENQMIGCTCGRGARGLDIAGSGVIVSGCKFNLADDAIAGASPRAMRFIGATTGCITGNYLYGLYGIDFNSQTLSGVISGNHIAVYGGGSVTLGSRSSMVLRGNYGLADAG